MNIFTAAEIKSFERTYDLSPHEDIANQARGEFLKDFPLESLPHLTLEEYVIGLQRPTFCTHVEAKTKPWANIQGATSSKFGIYFGKVKNDPKNKYRPTRKFGKTKAEAFKNVKSSLLDLIQLGQANEVDFLAIDKNPLSQMLKAKILSLYFPEKFINICSKDHLEHLGIELGFEEYLPSSEYQHLLLTTKAWHEETKDWSNPKYMSFLYQVFYPKNLNETAGTAAPVQSKTKKYPTVNFEDIQEQRDKIGKAAEDFALEWEKNRLTGKNLSELIPKIDDRRNKPGYGYDFLSHSSATQERYIEVKAVGKYGSTGRHRFFLSNNEHVISNTKEHSAAYFFYLVFFETNGKPLELIPMKAEELYQQSEILAASYLIHFDTKSILK